MQWTKERATRFGTFRLKRGSWHHVPYAVSTVSHKGMTRLGWAVAMAVSLIVIAIVLIEELVI